METYKAAKAFGVGDRVSLFGGVLLLVTGAQRLPGK